MKSGKLKIVLMIIICLSLNLVGAQAYETLRPGMKGREVSLLQKALTALGYQVKADGSYGPKTEEQVKAFQKKQNMEADGLAGNQTLTLIYSLSPENKPAESHSSGERSSLAAYVKTPDGKSLNLRRSASSGNNTLMMIPHGEQVAVLKSGNPWTKITYAGKTGYVMSRFLQSSKPGAVNQANKPAESAPDSQAPLAAQGTAYINTQAGRFLNLRNSPSTSGRNIIDKIPYNTAVAYSSRQNGWCAVVYQGQSGYVQESFLRFSDALAASESNKTEKPAAKAFSRTLRAGYTGADVSLLQEKLEALNFQSGQSGRYDERTLAAVRSFQATNGLKADGLFGARSAQVLLSGKAKSAASQAQSPASSGEAPAGVAQADPLPDSAGKVGGPAKSEVKLLKWYTEVKPALGMGGRMTVYHPGSGISFKLKVYSLGHHADSEPVSAEDTALMNRALGPASWNVRAVYIQLPGGSWTLASMHNYPHLSGSVKDNGFDGHLCVHFLRDMDEVTKNDPNYGVENQKVIRKTWKSMTGEIIE